MESGKDYFKSITIGVTSVAFSKNSILTEELNLIGFKKVILNSEGIRFKKDELIEMLSQCDIAIVGLDVIDEEILKHTPALRIISKYGVGLDNIDFEACSKYKVKVLHEQGVNKRSVSELALGMILSLIRNIYSTSNELKSGTWNKSGGYELTGKTVGIIGVGNIGKDLIELLNPFNCKIIVNDIKEQNEYYQKRQIKHVSLDVLFRNSDIISLHVPLTQITKNIIDRDAFDIMKPNVILINTARGGLVELNDLSDALKNGKIAGAGLDVYDNEPPTNIDLISHKKLINTPHIGGNSNEAVKLMGFSAIKNIVNYIQYGNN